MNTPSNHLSEYPHEYSSGQMRPRYYGKYRGIVSAVDAGTCRIKAKVPSVLGDADSGWCMACVPYAGPQVGIAFLPEEGSGVWIEFEGGDVSYPVWTGCYWREGEVPSGVGAERQGDRHQVTEPGGHWTTTQERSRISDNNGNSVTLDTSGITLSRGSQQVVIGDASVSVNDGALEVQ